MTNETIATLKENESIRIYPGMIVVFPQLEQEGTLNASEIKSKFNGCYAVNNSTICFVSENEMFVTPYTKRTIASLHHAGFHEEYFYVPFSNWDYPKNECAKWESLCKAAKKEYENDFVEECVTYCDKLNIGTISDETLQNCFEIPSTGVKVKHFYYEDCYYPILDFTMEFDCTAVECIGHFCTNNGKVVFVYRNGKTYVTKGYKILDELKSAGYTEMGLFVPFSNGEEIIDPILRKSWESIKK